MPGESWTAETCLSREWGNVEINHNESSENNTAVQLSHCPPIWDGFSCWGPTLAGTTASSKCPSLKGSDITKSAFRLCSPLAEWLDRDGIPGLVGWTNYTRCLTPEIRDVLRRLGSEKDAEDKINIAENTRVLEFVGLSLSLVALLLSLFIFYYFRVLRNCRTRIHCHLFIAMMVQVGIQLIVYSDQAITRYQESDQNSYDFSPAYSSGESDAKDQTMPTTHHRGIDNTPILCEASYILLEYARTAMCMWTFVEGLHLHNLMTITVFKNNIAPWIYFLIGWVLSIPLLLAWAVVTHIHYGAATCWWGYNLTMYFWILEGPRLTVLLINLAFLLSILKVLVVKLRQTNSTDTQLALKAVKAALLLLPLLGITNLLNMIPAPLEKSPLHFAIWSYTTHVFSSFQGFLLALLYCFKNSEVQTAVRKFFRVRFWGSSKHHVVRKVSSPLAGHENNFAFVVGDESPHSLRSQ